MLGRCGGTIHQGDGQGDGIVALDVGEGVGERCWEGCWERSTKAWVTFTKKKPLAFDKGLFADTVTKIVT